MKNTIIAKRKSIRKYQATELDASTLARIQEKITELTPLYADIPYKITISNQVRRAFGINAPHYLLFYTEQNAKAAQNIGFLGQQLDLYFSAHSIGACWVGMAKSELSTESKLPFAIAIAFGFPNEPLHRDISQFKRKTLPEISSGSDPRLNAARLAPSGINAQGWFFIAEQGNIHCYYKKQNALLGRFLGDLGQMDLGIALWHIASESDTFSFVTVENPPAQKGFLYAGTVV